MATPIKFRGKGRIRWFNEYGIRQSEIYGDRGDAQFALRRHETRAEEIRRGLRPSLGLNRTFDELCDYYLVHRSALKRRKRDDESLIRVHLRPFFGRMKLSEVVDKVDAFTALRANVHAGRVRFSVSKQVRQCYALKEKENVTQHGNHKNRGKFARSNAGNRSV